MEGSKQNKGLQSWKSFPIQQQPRWPCQQALEEAVESVRCLPPIVSPVEVLKLRDELGAIAEGRGFVLQGGDCAERFSDCKADVIETKIRLLLQMSGVLRHSTDEPCTVVARIAGQYGKPRSSCPLTEDPRKIFRGDNIHSYDDIEQRTPNPQRLIRGYFTSSTVMNYIRSLLKDGFDDIVHFPKSWDLDFLGSADNMKEHKEILARIHEDAYLRQDIQASDKTDVNIAHEAILLDYEAAMTREVEGKHYNLSAPFVWIGDRTRQLDHAHIEYIRQIENPIGIKVGPSMDAEELIQLLHMVWPNPEINPGRVTLITRYGVPNVERCLRKHIEAVQSTGYKVVWVCDPCHGNTQLSQKSGLKFRNAETLFEELRLNIETHRAMGSRLGGVHLELTGEDVTECIGGPEKLNEEDLPRRFESQCDPRLNYTQSMDFALKLAKVLRDNKATDTTSA